MAEGKFPRKDADFNTYIGTVVPYLTAEAAQLQVTPAQLAPLNGLKTAWDDLYPKSTNPNTATKTIRDSKNQTRKNSDWSPAVSIMVMV